MLWNHYIYIDVFYETQHMYFLCICEIVRAVYVNVILTLPLTRE